jgi:rsbT co-antagonist protein RsbR
MNSEAMTKMYADSEMKLGLHLYLDLITNNVVIFNNDLIRHYSDEPGFRPIMPTMTQEVLTKGNADNVARLRRGLDTNDWDPYLENLRARGVRFAKMGVDFISWSSVFQKSMLFSIDLAFHDHRDDPIKLKALLKGMSALVDTAVQVIGVTFADAHSKQIRSQHEALLTLSAPILDAGGHVLLVPLVGDFNDERANSMIDRLLPAVRAARAQTVILDLSGVAVVDTASVRQLLRCVEVVRLMGARLFLCGLSAGVCQSLVGLGTDLAVVATFATLSEALDAASWAQPLAVA